MQKWNIPTDRTQRKDEKIGVICLVIMFGSGVMVIKMSKMADFLCFLLIPANNQSQFGEIIYMRLKDIIYLFQKMLWIVDINPWVSLFFADSKVIWHFYSLYLTNGNPKTN